MTKADIVEKIQSTTGMTKKEASVIVECFFDTIKGVLETRAPLLYRKNRR